MHHVHIWPLSTTETALTAHMVQPTGSADELIRAAQRMLHDRFHIEHSTLQVERGRAGTHGNCETEDC